MREIGEYSGVFLVRSGGQKEERNVRVWLRMQAASYRREYRKPSRLARDPSILKKRREEDWKKGGEKTKQRSFLDFL